MIRPEALKHETPWIWSTGSGTDVWEMFCACVSGELETVGRLLNKDSSLVRSHYDYRTPLYFAVRENQVEVAELLLDHGADPIGLAVTDSLLQIARDRGYAEMERQDGARPIHLCNGDYQEIVALNGARSVGILAHYGDVDAAEKLFGDNPALADDPEALENAARNGQEDFVRLMLRYQPGLPKRVAFVAKTRALTELLFAHGMDPSLPDWLLVTPLHRFAERGDIESAAIFIDHGASRHARDEDNRSTPLGWAAKFGKTLAVEFLLRRGAKPNLPGDPPWATPLAWATSRRHDDIVRLLGEYEKSGALPAHSPEQYENLARDLVEAYQSGDDDSLQRIVDYFQIQRPVNWDRAAKPVPLDRFRRYVRDRLGRRLDAQTETETLALAEAQALIARSHGFESWLQLVEHAG